MRAITRAEVDKLPTTKTYAEWKKLEAQYKKSSEVRQKAAKHYGNVRAAMIALAALKEEEKLDLKTIGALARAIIKNIPEAKKLK